MGNDEKEKQQEKSKQTQPQTSQKAAVSSLLDRKVDEQNQTYTDKPANKETSTSQVVTTSSSNGTETSVNVTKATIPASKTTPTEYNSSFFKQSPGESKEMFGERMKQFALSQGYPAVASMGSADTKSAPAVFSPIISSLKGALTSGTNAGTKSETSSNGGTGNNTFNIMLPGATSGSSAGSTTASVEPQKSSYTPLAMPLIGGSLGVPAPASSISSSLVPREERGEAVLRQSETYSINEITEQPAIINILNVNNSKNILVASNG